MSRYIDAGEVLKGFSCSKCPNECELRNRIVEAPTKDVVEVTRCRHCRYWSKYSSIGDTQIRTCLMFEKNTHIDDYCSRGEKEIV
jgi:hypothetical protein